jgi:predicted phosphoadenosine phosphosulfate sulfurtransferase
MSSGYWQTKRQSEQFSNGSTITRRVTDYIATWEKRCYFDGIPDFVPIGVMKSNRAPSYKAIALAILRNDHNMYSLGFSERTSERVNMIIEAAKEKQESANMDMFS